MSADVRPKGRPRLVAGTFLAAFAATVGTVIYTGLLVEAPRTEIAAALPSVELVVGQKRSINLVFDSATALDSVSLRVSMPAGVDLVGHEGEREVRWRTRLAAGSNILPITLVAAAPATGQIVARIQHGEHEKVFRVFVEARPG